MDAVKAKQLLSVITALANGEKVQYFHTDIQQWRDEPELDFCEEVEKYRVKPKPLELWVGIYEGSSNSSCTFDTKEECEKCCTMATRIVKLVESAG